MSTARRTRASVLVLIAVLLAAIVASAPPAAAAPRSMYCGASGDARWPVLLVHGFNSGPDTWGEPARKQLAEAGTSTCIDVFDYAERSTFWVTDSAIGPALATRIEKLAKASAAAGGTGKVIVVAHSMGGLATRCASSRLCNGGKQNIHTLLADVITFGTPNTGSYLVTDPGKGIAPLLSAGCQLSLDTLFGLCDTLKALGTSDAGRAFKSDSAELQVLPPLPNSVPVYALAASIEVHSSFFGMNDAVLGDYGDLIVDRRSATFYANEVGELGGQETIDCGTFDITAWKWSTNTCWHRTETNDTRFLGFAAWQIGLVQKEYAKKQAEEERQQQAEQAATTTFPSGRYSRRMATLELRQNGTGVVTYRVGRQAAGCTASSTSRQDCYLNAEFALTPGPGPYQGSLTRVWFTESELALDTSDYAADLPKVGAPMSLRLDPPPDKALYEDSHGKIDLCGPNPTVQRQSCS